MYLDIFIYPENEFTVLKQEHVTMDDGIVIMECNGFGENLISQLQMMIEEPEHLPVDEIHARKVWYKKMLSRASRRDLEGQYRHIWSIFAMLEDYFIFRKLRYHGPKKAFHYLEIHDKETLTLFDDALGNTHDLSALARLIEKIVT